VIAEVDKQVEKERFENRSQAIEYYVKQSLELEGKNERIEGIHEEGAE
jgi:Arc/MetJ-type ribon-helix-helix transcriptional regulator